MDISIFAKSVKSEEFHSSESACAYVRKSRLHQCDDSALLIIKDEYALIGVFDGASGEVNASTASETALRAIANYVERYFEKKKPEELLENAIEEANYAVQAGGTTASVALALPDGSYFYVNVGDSHIYSVSKGKVMRLTIDDRDSSSYTSYVKGRYYLSQCIGGLIKNLDSGKGKLANGGFLLIVSDGVLDNLKLKVEGGVLTDTSGKDDLQKLIENKETAKSVVEELAEEIKKRMELKEELIAADGIIAPKEDDASIVVFMPK